RPNPADRLIQSRAPMFASERVHFRKRRTYAATPSRHDRMLCEQWFRRRHPSQWHGVHGGGKLCFFPRGACKKCKTEREKWRVNFLGFLLSSLEQKDLRLKATSRFAHWHAAC